MKVNNIINKFWVAGYFVGEGSFIASLSSPHVSVQFSGNKGVLDSINEFFKENNITFRIYKQSQTVNDKERTNYVGKIHKIADCKKFTEVFDEDIFLNKTDEYKIWTKIVTIFDNKKKGLFSNENFNTLLDLLSKLRSFHKKGRKSLFECITVKQNEKEIGELK